MAKSVAMVYKLWGRFSREQTFIQRFSFRLDMLCMCPKASIHMFIDKVSVLTVG